VCQYEVVTERLAVDPSHPDANVIALAAERLRSGALVAFPTETVYGLGAHALDRDAVARLFTAKERPESDPLIVHVRSLDEAAPLVRSIPPEARRLAAAFWPGPLTLVLRRSSKVPDEVTAGLDTVAIRAPSHPVARALVAAARVPVAAPSANRFSRPSPTRAAHVLEDLDGRIDLVLDGGPTPVGVESTVIDLTRRPPAILRPGAVTLEALREIVPDVILASTRAAVDGPQASPGLLEKHYSPRAPLTLYDGARSAVIDALLRDADRERAAGRRVGLLLAEEDRRAVPPSDPDILVGSLGTFADPAAVAANLYDVLRRLDASGVDVILARAFPEAIGLAPAIRDRLLRAASGRVVLCDPSNP
jgi:L-threonylcarbamoyladenylate synthase